ncbi:hypothetical protein ACFFUT_06340 [Pseudohalocynthiibacter aestuariivivens]|jgi:hypothetical protein|uniref:Uncharacterized protein n=1 Tax=Pseudohalocynthiibacter aestuariivivens TaxID=1591409 RepID=A0ABV5JD85_9RHOB|nr:MULTISPECIES: hypothetical protein [Pseudohalocynthiibacter]MBS9717105.1 hypothetical protein [Pseudohalocynthiibacter aestuariivivens]MCK0103971.1 hypothetical protein [Pseudohalocynthiibacter sp. F2068]
MTALSKYDRLESTGLWRASPEHQKREVVVSFGDATLVLSDQNETALAHWSLPAVSRLNPGKRPAMFSPDPEAIEILELDDETMIQAIEKIRRALSRNTPHPGRLRLIALGVSIATVSALAFLWLPGALVRQAAAVVPDVKRAEIGQRLRTNIRRLTGDTCSSELGDQALNRLRARLLPEGRKLVVVRSGVSVSEHLPGGYILMNRALVEDHEDPEVVAGYILAEALRSQLEDPLERLLKATGPITSFRLLTTGSIPNETLANYAETFLTIPKSKLPDEALLALFEAAELRSSPYAYAVDVSGETTIGLIEADPFRSNTSRPVLSDGDWISLQNICEE